MAEVELNSKRKGYTVMLVSGIIILVAGIIFIVMGLITMIIGTALGFLEIITLHPDPAIDRLFRMLFFIISGLAASGIGLTLLIVGAVKRSK